MYSIKCPFCPDILFSSETNEHGRLLKTPRLEFATDSNPFMTCPHCQKKVDFVISAPSGGQGILVALAAL
jgi:endogenous inhibitor of DNA gyrase (YacG/DUF329 family)